MPQDGRRVIGCDISMNHGAMVELLGGRFLRAWYFHGVLKCVSKAKDVHNVQATRIVEPKLVEKDQEHKDFLKSRWISDWMLTSLSSTILPRALAYERTLPDGTGRITQLAAMQAVFMNKLYDAGARLRSYDPATLKMFAVWNGAASKDMMEAAVRERWSADFTCFNTEAKDNKISEDLVDAFVAAKVLDIELQIREGTLALSDLEDNKERTVFLKVTKSYPTNILARPFIESESYA